MRRIFSSQRVENVEGVAQMLRDAGIEVRVTNGRSYHGRRRGQFSYLDKTDPAKLPAVWVVFADDQPRAREILRNARLLDTTRRDHPTAEYAFADTPAPAAAKNRSWGWRIRFILIAAIAGLVLVMGLRPRGVPEPDAGTSASPAQQPGVPAQEDAHEVRVRIHPSGPSRGN